MNFAFDGRRRLFWLLTAGLFVISFFLYWPNPRMGFVLDDHYVIAQNPVIKNPSLYPQILSGGLFDAANRAPESKLNYYRPVLTASFTVDYQLWGNDAFGYRLVNIAIHAFNCALVFVMFFLLFRNGPLAAMTSLIFCILPTHEWVVRYITGRGDLLQAFFSLSCFIFVIRYCDMLKRGWLYLAMGAFMLAVLSREAAVTNVLFIFLIGFYLSHDLRKTFRLLIPFLALAVLYALARGSRMPVVSDGGAVSLWGLIDSAGFILQWWTPALVLGVLPYADWIAAVLALSGVGFLVMTLMRSSRDGLEHDLPLASFGILWVASGLMPLAVTHRIVERLGPVLSEHFLYFASIGFAFLSAFMLQRMKHMLSRKIMIVGIFTYFIVIGLLNGYFWSSEAALLRHVQRIEGRPGTVAYEQIAMRFADDEEAVIRLINNASSHVKRSLWLKRLGNIYHKRGDYQNAIAALNEAVRLDGKNIEAINELAVCHLEMLDTQKGMELLERSIALKPNQTDAWRIKGIALYRWGKFNEALDPLRQALLSDPSAKEPLLHLMMAQYFLGDHNAYLKTVDRITPRVCDQREMLGFAAIELFSHDHFRESLKVLSDSAPLWRDDARMMGIWQEAHRRAALPQ